MIQYWGKTNEGRYHLLAYHSLDVTACVVRLLERSDRLAVVLERSLDLPRNDIVQLMGWATCLHDLGKLSPAFQRQDKATSLIADQLGVGIAKSLYDTRHDSLGWSLWGRIAGGVLVGLAGTKDLIAANAIMRCSTGHHGKPPTSIGAGTRITAEAYFNPEDIQAGIDWSVWATNYFKPIFPKAAAIERASWWIAGIITLSDWLGSNIDWFPYVEGVTSTQDYFERALMQADRAITESGVVLPQAHRSYAQLFPTYAPTDVQQAVLELPTKGTNFFLVVEESTGGGKTEAALSAAGGSNFYFGLPTMATANGLWSRVGHLDGQQTLIHGKRWFMPNAMDRASAWLNDNGRKALLADIGVGTIDQAMIAVMYARYGTLRLTGLAGKTLIIDEVHAYDTYMKKIQEVLIEVHARSGGSVILLSATLPLSHREDYAQAWCRGASVPAPTFYKHSFPLITFIDSNGHVIERDDLASRYQKESGAGRRVKIETCSNADEIVERIINEARLGKCVAWIRNTVGEAIEAYSRLHNIGAKVSLFHSRFVIDDRTAIERQVMEDFGKDSMQPARAGKILIATQVIEQSLDLDFDFMVTDLCPVDLLIQRAGRLQRHDRGAWSVARGLPVLMVYAPEMTENPSPSWVKDWSKGSSFIYADHSKLWLSLKLVADGFSLPRDARRLVEGVYGDLGIDIPKGLEMSAIEFSGKEIARATGGETAAINPRAAYKAEGIPMWDDTQAPTRLGEKTIEYVVCESGIPVTGNINTSTLQVRANMFSGAPSAKIDVGKYRQSIDLLHGEARAFKNNKPVRLRYSKTIGLVVE